MSLCKRKASVVNISINGVSLDVEYTYHKAWRGARDRSGQQLEPDEPAHIEIDAVTSTEDITGILTGDMIEQIEEKALEKLSEDQNSDEERN